MAWSDPISFEEIEHQYGLSENQLKKIMRRLIQYKSYKRWRRRVKGRKSKHSKRHINKNVYNTTDKAIRPYQSSPVGY